MLFKDQTLWEQGIANNRGSYGSAVYRFAQRWAEAMEQGITAGANLEDIAKPLSHETDTEGITGFQYGAAVSVLASCWEHGERLRIWHNLATQIQHEGEQANKKGTVLNPALLNIG